MPCYAMLLIQYTQNKTSYPFPPAPIYHAASVLATPISRTTQSRTPNPKFVLFPLFHLISKSACYNRHGRALRASEVIQATQVPQKVFGFSGSKTIRHNLPHKNQLPVPNYCSNRKRVGARHSAAQQHLIPRIETRGKAGDKRRRDGL